MGERIRQYADLLGAHVSTQGGVQNGPRRGTDIRATAIQIFTKTPNQWREPKLEAATCDQFKAEMA
ncbi:MAG TPA: hypothetical protein VMJ30_10815, partial [Gemmatimonadales bacterium]|nr:hypothetical protein [Gemmatimonadales bacterium]